jgi:hypothetical protein
LLYKNVAVPLISVYCIVITNLVIFDQISFSPFCNDAVAASYDNNNAAFATIEIQVSQKECARLREGVPYVKVYRYNPKHLCPKLNG